jgi:cold shock CspA family protein
MLQKIIERSDEIERLSEELGVVKEVHQDGFGKIWVESRSVEVFFYFSQIKDEINRKLAIGDKVSFRMRENEQGYQALEIDVIEPTKLIEEKGQQIYGFVISYNNIRHFGFIKVLDEGENVYFHRSNFIRFPSDYPKNGDFVEFEIHKSEKGRSARKITRIISMRK